MQMSTTAAEMVREIARKSGNLKGSFVKLLKEVANQIPALVLSMRDKSTRNANDVGCELVGVNSQLEQKLKEQEELLREKDLLLLEHVKHMDEMEFRSRVQMDSSGSKSVDGDEDMRHMLIDIRRRVGQLEKSATDDSGHRHFPIDIKNRKMPTTSEEAAKFCYILYVS